MNEKMNEMNEKLIEALDAWEAGDLPADELVARHPEAAAIFAVHQKLWALTHEPTPDPERSLAIVRRRIAEPPAVARPRRVSKALVAALVAAALTGSAAIAAPGAVRSVVDGVRHGIERLFGSNEAGDTGTNQTPPSSSEPAVGSLENSGDNEDGNAPGNGENQGGSGDEQGDSGSGGTNEGDQGSQGNEDESSDQGDQGQDEPQGGGDQQGGGSEDQQSGGQGQGGQGQGGDHGQGGGQDEGGGGQQ
jgi:hypothetical protein